jgi:hypothetical protein
MKLTIAFVVWIVLACRQGVADDRYYPWPKFTVSPSGRFIAVTYRNRDENRSLLAIIDTSTPAKRQVVGDAYPGFPGIVFSSDERWMLVVDLANSNYFSATDKDPARISLLRRGDESKFEPATSPNFLDLVSRTGGSKLNIRSGQWIAGSDNYVFSVIESAAPDSDNYRVWQLRAAATDSGTPARVLMDNKFTENELAAWEQKGIGQNIEDQLNAVYKVLAKNLNRGNQTDLILEERQWLSRREKLPAGFDQSYYTQRRVQELVQRLIVLQGTSTHLDDNAAPSFIEFVLKKEGNPAFDLRLEWGNHQDVWQAVNWQATVSTDRAFAAFSWQDEMDNHHFGFGRSVDQTRYRFDQALTDQIKAKILSALLEPKKLSSTSCDSSRLLPDHWEDAENVVIKGEASGSTGQLVSYSLTNGSVLYNVKQASVVKVLGAGKFESTPKDAVAGESDNANWVEMQSGANGEPTFTANDKDREQPHAYEFSVSPDRAWVAAFRHLSTGNWFDLYQRQKNGKYLFKTSINLEDFSLFADAFALHGLSQKDLGDHYGTGLEGWVGKSHQLIVGFHCRLEQRGPHGVFYQFGDWTGVYDPDKGKVIEQLTPGSIWEPL